MPKSSPLDLLHYSLDRYTLGSLPDLGRAAFTGIVVFFSQEDYQISGLHIH
jgi:hypothetical protein